MRKICFSILAVVMTTVSALGQTISYVDTSLSGSEKFTLRVDGKPFYPTNVQMRWDKLYGYNGWVDSEMELCAKQAAADGFNTLSVPVFWAEVEPVKNEFSWDILDKYMGWCKKYGMHMELLWFSWSSGGRVQYLWNYGGKVSARTPDYVCSLDGTSEFNVLHKSWEYSLDWRDTNLRDRETYVLSKVMDHIADWEEQQGQPHTVIGVQLGNEARTHNENTATAAEIIEYYSAVGSAVKNSRHKVWTRLNCVSYETAGRTSANETKRNNGGTNIDFVGVDVYGTNAGSVKGDISGYLGVNGKNYRMIMEIDALDSNSPIYQMAALAGDKAFDYYNYCVVDGNAMYGNNGHTLVARDHVTLVRQRNKILNLANQDIATKKQGSGLYVYNYAGNSIQSESGIKAIAFKPILATTQAIAIVHSYNEILLLSTAAGTFTIPSSMKVKRVSYGHTDDDNRWVEDAEGSMTNETTFKFLSAGCVRLELGDSEGDDDGGWVVNGEFDDATMSSQAPAGWNVSFSTWTSKISVVAKGDGSVIKDGENHWQVWNGSGLTGKMYQTITGLPAGRYSLRAGLYCTFGGTVSLYANDNSTAVVSGQNAYLTTELISQGVKQTNEIGLQLATEGVTDIEFDHVTLTLIEQYDDPDDPDDPTFEDKWVTIKNGAMWKRNGYTASGASTTVQAHAAGFLQVGNKWYMCGEDRSNTWQPDVNLYSSSDLVNWKFERKIVSLSTYYPDPVADWHMIERPKLLYCAKTGKYLVWCHFEYSNYGAQEAACFECDSVNGPYKYVWSGQPYGTKARDCNVFQDNDGKAYFVATISDNNHIGLFELSDDYHSVVAQTTLFWWKSREAPAIVHVGDYYYMLSSACSGWAPNRCKMAYSKSLTSGWSDLIDLNNPIAYDTQAAQIITIQGTKATTYLYVGDRWQDPGLFESKTIIFPISFSGTTCSFPYHQQFDLNLYTGEWRETPTEGIRVPKKNWKVVSVSDDETTSEYAPARYAIDGNLNSYWHSHYTGYLAPFPHDITVDMGDEYNICGFCAMPRMDNSNNGIVRQFTLQTSLDGEHWTLATGGSWLPYGGEVYFPETQARYFRFSAKSADSGDYVCVSEIDMLLTQPTYKPYTLTGSHTTGSTYTSTKSFSVKEGRNVTFKTSSSQNTGVAGDWAFGGGYGVATTGDYSLLADTVSQEAIVSNVKPEMSGDYVGAFYNRYFNETSIYTYTMNVKPLEDAIESTPSTARSEELGDRSDSYNLSGLKVDAGYKGIVIRNGKKCFIR